MVLTNRLQTIIQEVISPFQNALAKGRSITDNILIAHEVLRYIRRQKKTKANWDSVKIDLQKAYNKISWDFHEDVLVEMGFPAQWVRLILQCVTTTSFRIQINGELSTNFKPQAGLKQGDLISPYLFILCMNVLSGILMKRHDDGTLKGVNPHKSEISFSPNTPSRVKKELNSQCKFKIVDHFSKYLGSFIDEPPRSFRIFDIVMEKIHDRLKGWQTQLLSQAAQTVLIKSILSSLPLYHLSYFKLDSQEAHKCDMILSDFFWGMSHGKKSPHMRAWDHVCKAKSAGGLGIKKKGEFNSALIRR